ncbi:PREDICTED: embryonic stem cell-related gene protein-like [Rhinopithecus bieti]|uniref:embryonic stem cell-related gene protein-like n=1 Tax=Rhinopithecus bieti TaxID=61621 RepID=UPI00083BED64|nr:PREDICTED: embryonic stem cell-related gene protein-like [Rhinopithecus bieti]
MRKRIAIQQGSLHMDMWDIWCRKPWSVGLLRETLSSLSLGEEIHLRPRVLRPTSPRNISPILNRVITLRNMDRD